MIPAPLSSAAAPRRKSKGLDMSVIYFFRAMSERKLNHCASFKINSLCIPTLLLSLRLLSKCSCCFCLIVLLPRGSKHEGSLMIWFGAEQVNSLCGVTQCVNTLQKDDQYTAEAGFVSLFPQLHIVLSVFRLFSSLSHDETSEILILQQY